MNMVVILQDHVGARRRARVDTSRPVHELREAIVAALGTPTRDGQGRRVVYHLGLNGRQLQDNETLEGAGATENAVVSVVPEMVAGASAHPIVELLPDDPPVAPFLPPSTTWPGGPRVAVSAPRDVLRRIERHARAHVNHEVGGVLLGHVEETDVGYLVWVRSHLAARYTRATAASLTFTAQTWLDITTRRESQPDRLIVGWYHSHPGYGVFLSSQDLFSHAHYFNRASWYVSLVVDPIHHEWGFFTVDNGRVKPCPILDNAQRLAR